MRLKKIKLAGFKSFVDPTTVALPGKLTAIVGPNGCGKSNIIDAVRWVMGESSAKHLRGESMTDVIFNGSNARKPVGQASIELVFDNSGGALGGNYAAYSEVSIKRVVNRDAQSNYLINGSRCRRRDITDLFLGTGLGPRSYAIIEQGVVSTIIGAKPDELRLYIEEAAGISKYKERRKETEQRIQHTRENLERLDDIRGELERQLERLRKQSDAAIRYKELSEQSRQLSGMLTAWRWQQLRTKEEQLTGAARDETLERERLIAVQREHETQLEAQRLALHDRHQLLQTVQADFYQLGTEIARCEEQIQHHQAQRAERQKEADRSQASLAHVNAHYEQDIQSLQTVEAQLNTLQPEMEQLSVDRSAHQARVSEAESVLEDARKQWDEINKKAAQHRQEAEVAQTQQRHYETSLQRIKQRLHEVTHKLEHHEGEAIEQGIEKQRCIVEAIEQQQTALEEKRSAVQGALQLAREEERALHQQWNTQQKQLQQCVGRRASLDALQQAALSEGNKAIEGWLKAQGWDSVPHFAQSLDVPEQWMRSVEMVLNMELEALVVDPLEDVSQVASSLPKGGVFLKENTAMSCDVPEGSLASLVNSELALPAVLMHVYAMPTLQDALDYRSKLAYHESCITPGGVWLGPNWIRLHVSDETEEGVLQREKLLEALQKEEEELGESIALLEAQRSEKREVIGEHEVAFEKMQQERQALMRSRGDEKATLSRLQAQKDHQRVQMDTLEKEKEKLFLQRTEDEQHLKTIRQTLADAVEKMAADELNKEDLDDERHALEQSVKTARQAQQSLETQWHDCRVQIQKHTSEKNSLSHSLQRLKKQKEELLTRIDELTSFLNDSVSPIEAIQHQLNEKLEQRLKEEENLSAQRDHVAALEAQIRSLEQEVQKVLEALERRREQLEKIRLEIQSISIHAQQMEEELASEEQDLKSLLSSLDAAFDEAEYEQALEMVLGRIKRLGAINLAAIDEFEAEKTRKEYLDDQHADLVSALTMLEDAINKIDEETRTRFKETFDQISEIFQRLFPKLFGGGNAELTLVGDDLLSAGVSLMARPPGKRNSTIHLLSGGEKALTAIALVFAIFQLNPAPFCMLDEVDAPLDDANVGRFCELVSEMSQTVQFIFISHNKLAMSMADQLVGVTMREAGVSRLVSVDMDEALAMSET